MLCTVPRAVDQEGDAWTHVHLAAGILYTKITKALTTHMQNDYVYLNCGIIFKITERSESGEYMQLLSSHSAMNTLRNSSANNLTWYIHMPMMYSKLDDSQFIRLSVVPCVIFVRRWWCTFIHLKWRTLQKILAKFLVVAKMANSLRMTVESNGFIYNCLSCSMVGVGHWYINLWLPNKTTQFKT